MAYKPGIHFHWQVQKWINVTFLNFLVIEIHSKYISCPFPLPLEMQTENQEISS